MTFSLARRHRSESASCYQPIENRKKRGCPHPVAAIVRVKEVGGDLVQCISNRSLVPGFRMQRRDSEAMPGRQPVNYHVGNARVAFSRTDIKGRYLGHDRAGWQRAVQPAEFALEALTIEGGDVVGADRHRHDVGIELRERWQLDVESVANASAGNTEIDHTHGSAGAIAEVFRDQSDVAAAGPTRADSLRRRIAERHVEKLAGLTSLLLPPFRVEVQGASDAGTTAFATPRDKLVAAEADQSERRGDGDDGEGFAEWHGRKCYADRPDAAGERPVCSRRLY